MRAGFSPSISSSLPPSAMASHDHAGSGDIKHRSVSPSGHAQHYQDPTALGLDPSMSAFAANPSFDNSNPDPGLGGAESYGYSANYLSPAPPAQNLAPPQEQPFPPTINTNNIPISQSFEASLVNQLEHGSQGLRPPQPDENFSNLLNTNAGDLDFSAYQNHSPNSTSASEYDTSLLLDPQMHQRPSSMHQAVNPADLVSPISNPSASSHPSSQDQQQSSPGPMSPPGSTPGTYYTPQHSRHTSLDPATAAYMNAQSNTDWPSMMTNSAFQGHRRAPSEVSEVSSANHSPYLSQHEYDGIENNTSPSLAPQNDPALYDNALGIESFTLSEQHQQQQGFSPLHSPYISPRLMPQQGGEMVPNAPYLSPNVNSQFPNAPTDMYGMPGDDMMNTTMQGGVTDIGQASQMAPPSINVEFAPPSRNPSFGPSKPAADLDSLSPPAMSELLSPILPDLQILIQFQDPESEVNLIPMHTRRLVHDLRRIRQRALNLLLPVLPAHCRLTRAVTLVRATTRRPDPIAAFRHRRLKAGIIYSTWRILSVLVQLREIPSEFRSTLRPSNAPYVPNGLPVLIIYGPTCELTRMSGRLYVRSAARHLRVSTIGSATRVCIQAKRSLSARVTSQGVDTGVVVVASPVPTPWAVISDRKQAEYVSSHFWMRSPRSATVSSWTSSSSPSKHLDTCSPFHSHWSCLVSRAWIASHRAISSFPRHYWHNTPLCRRCSGTRSLLQEMIPVI